MFHQHQISGDDGPLNLVQGPESGPPLLFLHGVGRCWQDFTGLMTSLAARWQVFGLDFRGHGLSARTGKSYFVRDYVRDALSAARYIGRPIALYGHSLGGMTAGLAAEQLGPQALAAVLEDPPYELFRPGAVDTPFHSLFRVMQQVSSSDLPIHVLAQQLADTRLPSPDDPQGIRLGDLREATSIRFGAACLKRVDPQVWEPVLRGEWLADCPYGQKLSRITCPVLVLQGNPALGGMVTDAEGEQLASWIPDNIVLRWNDAGHLIHSQFPERTLRTVFEFLESVALAPSVTRS